MGKKHILREYEQIRILDKRKANVIIVGAGFIGVEWVTELNYFFKSLNLTVIDLLPCCLGPLPAKAAEYCSKYMRSVGIKEFYSTKYAPNTQAFWDRIGLPH